MRAAARFGHVRGPGVPTAWDAIVPPAAAIIPSPPPPARPAKPAASPARRAGASPHQNAFDFSAPGRTDQTPSPASSASTGAERGDTPAIDAPDPVRLQFGLDDDMHSGTER